ncbi:FAD binding domain-containing protein [Halococcus hamelinensis]|uniref:Molybdopterin dehydrogenase FAD-binding protein n=1 Tax=Halococcus hamelinensis 100A6 TaxID=1132509 RepID=M0M0P5_9EURY|nr:xanthine dehydrogenase family protein subunit M [Halococcus hamelinensis]EMA38189.1 molybdopterin dehydrogenase FAD-binding protein [Halococcus hamelinensis 100A6]
MFPDEFDYYEAESVAEAIELLDEHADEETELLAGGHSLLPAMKTGLSSPDVLIDISGIEGMTGVTVDGDTLSIGGMTTYGAILESEEVAEHAPALEEAVAWVGDVQVRNRGTIGGNLAHGDPAADLPGAALASNATLVVEGPDGERKVPADEFFFGMFATDVGPDELLTRVEIPVADGAVGAYAKKASPSSGYAMVGVAALLDIDGDTIESARVAANGVMDHGVRLEPVEEALVDGTFDADTIEAAADHAGDDLDVDLMMSDLQASNEFRAQLLEVYTKRALTGVHDAADRTAAD